VGMCGLDTMTNDELDRRTEETWKSSVKNSSLMFEIETGYLL